MRSNWCHVSTILLLKGYEANCYSNLCRMCINYAAYRAMGEGGETGITMYTRWICIGP